MVAYITTINNAPARLPLATKVFTIIETIKGVFCEYRKIHNKDSIEIDI